MPNLENLLSTQIEIKKLENYFGMSVLELIEFSKKNPKDFENCCLEIGYKFEPKVEVSTETPQTKVEVSTETPQTKKAK